MKKQTYAKYHYFGDRSKSRTNVITFATILNKQDNCIEFAFSCSNNKDIYNKAVGRTIAFNRLTNKEYVDTIDLNGMDCRYSDINKYLYNYIQYNYELFPSWSCNVE